MRILLRKGSGTIGAVIGSISAFMAIAWINTSGDIISVVPGSAMIGLIAGCLLATADDREKVIAMRSALIGAVMFPVVWGLISFVTIAIQPGATLADFDLNYLRVAAITIATAFAGATTGYFYGLAARVGMLIGARLLKGPVTGNTAAPSHPKA